MIGPVSTEVRNLRDEVHFYKTRYEELLSTVSRIHDTSNRLYGKSPYPRKPLKEIYKGSTTDIIKAQSCSSRRSMSSSELISKASSRLSSCMPSRMQSRHRSRDMQKFYFTTTQSRANSVDFSKQSKSMNSDLEQTSVESKKDFIHIYDNYMVR